MVKAAVKAAAKKAREDAKAVKKDKTKLGKPTDFNKLFFCTRVQGCSRCSPGRMLKTTRAPKIKAAHALRRTPAKASNLPFRQPWTGFH